MTTPPIPVPDASGAFDMTGHVAVVTGAGRGLGEGIAKTLAAANAAVVVAARRTDEIERVASEIREAGGQSVAVTTDVTDSDALVHLADTATSEFGPLTTWVNNAGGSPDRMPLSELTRDGWDHCVALNITAIWEASNIAAQRMDEGSILNISSIASHVATPGSGHYAAAKAATNSLTKTFSAEFAPKIRVNCICPGAVPTEIMMHALNITEEHFDGIARRIPMKRMGTPVDLGLAALYLSSPAAAWVTGQIIDISGGQGV
jgi:NAD(P)-dependent dehydrogenase (short-subunit alcohol dehydrogenase family)